MKRTSGLIVAAVGILLLSRVASVHALPHPGSAAIHTGLSKTTVVPAEDSGDDSSDDSDSDDAE